MEKGVKVDKTFIRWFIVLTDFILGIHMRELLKSKYKDQHKDINPMHLKIL